MTRKQEAAIEQRFQAALWYRNLRETNNKAFLPLFWDEHRYLVLKGGGGSGKSIFAGRKILERCTSEPGHRWLVVRKVAKTLRESCFEQLKGQAYQYYSRFVDFIPRGKGSDMYIRFTNGSEILFAGLDDVEKLKSIYDITGVWIEEASEVDEADFNQLDIRLRTKFPYYLQIIITFNPISLMHWLKKRFFDFDIADPQLREEAVRNTRTHESTYKDNRFLTPEAIRVLESFRGTDEYYYMVYCLGQWGVTGKTVFDRDKLAKRLGQLQKPKEVGLLEYDYDGLKVRNIRWVNSRSGCVKVWKEPEKGVPYVIGADTAGDGSDFFVGQVLDNRTGEQVAVLRGHFDEDVFARQLYSLGIRYNTALIGTEVNFSTYPTLELERLGYPKLFVRERFDSYKHEYEKSYGFRTDQKTRPVILAELVKWVRDETDMINDETTIQEMLSFVRNPESLRPEAEPGAHDDCVLSLAIAQHIRPQQSYLQEADEKRARWTESMWEDYENADREGREFLIQKWGRPR